MEKEKIELIGKIIIIFIIMILFLLILFLIDLFNLPSKFGFNNTINLSIWLSSIIGSLVTITGFLITVVISIYQIKKNIDSNEKNRKENLRIQNMPVLKYDFYTSIYDEDFIVDNESSLIDTEFNKDYVDYPIYVYLTNVGLNTIKNAKIDILSEKVKIKNKRIFGSNTIKTIEKGETVKIERNIRLKPGPNYIFTIEVYYEDILNNWYLQKINLNYHAYSEEGRGSIKFEVLEEKMIEK